MVVRRRQGRGGVGGDSGEKGGKELLKDPDT